ncbi:DUF417 family protein [Maricaulis parjimensis]|uniref:DUF417 family protein n=1 Tax=Maricaulis parjimensis TaxID=144023 RepID=UPI00193AC1F1|nr:DUF417 family protein [Maricaulis parjimensis]
MAVMFAWFGVMNFTPVGTGITESWLSNHAFLSGVANQSASAARALGIYQLVAAALIAAPLPGAGLRRIGFGMFGLYAAIALTLMLTNPVWLEAEGGFPAIGSGQGILKYIAMLGLALWAGSFENSRMFSSRYSDMRLWSQPVMWAGLFLVLLWIGGMKFTASEAAGIEPLVTTHLIFSWMTPLMGLQNTSYVIGVIELVTALALTGFWFHRGAYRAGLFLSAITFVLTLSFLVSFSGSWSADLGGFPALGRSGHFLLKDLPLLAVVLALWAETGPEGTRRGR